MMSYKHFFGFTKGPFAQDIGLEDLYPLPGLQAATERFLYALKLGAVSIITGDTGSGKPTTLRYAAGSSTPRSTRSSASWPPPVPWRTCSNKSVTASTWMTKPTPWPAHRHAPRCSPGDLRRLHTISQFTMDSKPLPPIVLAGQNNLIDKLMFHTCRPLASRIIGKSHREGLKYKDMAGYIAHHLKIAGITQHALPGGGHPRHPPGIGRAAAAR